MIFVYDLYSIYLYFHFKQYRPCILIFDSLAGASRARVVATLRDYLSCEYVAKMGQEKVFSKDTIKGASLKVPQQSNFTDCGLYVLQYVESFFKVTSPFNFISLYCAFVIIQSVLLPKSAKTIYR